MSANLRVYTKALYGFDHVVRLVPDDGWSNPTPCAGWTIADVVGHVIAVQRYLEALADGSPPSLDPYTSPRDHVGDDPRGAWNATLDDVLAALDHPDVIGRTVQTFRAAEPLDDQLGWNVVDTLTHTWDVARGAGLDADLDPALVDHALAQATPMIDHMRQPPFFGPAAPAPSSADPQTRLLAMLGRSPTAAVG